MVKLWKIVLLLAICASLMAAHAQAGAEHVWKPAVYHGLTIGKSSKSELVLTLGKPRSSGKEQDTGIPTVTYDVSDPVRGTLIVYLKSGIIDGMTLVPKKQLNRADVMRMLGPNPLRVRYATADCLTEGGSAPIYESPDGSIEHLEYRETGTAIVLHNGVIQSIVFVHRPFGPRHSPCAGRRATKAATK